MQQLKCEQPQELRGSVFTEMEPKEFCDMPLILKLAIQDIQPYSVLVSWQSREHTGLHGYHIIYHSLDGMGEVNWNFHCCIFSLFCVYFFIRIYTIPYHTYQHTPFNSLKCNSKLIKFSLYLILAHLSYLLTFH